MTLRARLLVLALVDVSATSCVKEWRQRANWNPGPAWSHAPLIVDATAMPPVFEESVRDAERAWNHAAGCDVLIPASKLGEANVVLSGYDGTACGRDAQLEETGDAVAGTWRCSVDRAEVKFRAMSDIRSVFVTAQHEFGHVLGLAHDRSILMQAAPQLYEPQDFGRAPELMPLPSDADGAAVGGRYCRGEP